MSVKIEDRPIEQVREQVIDQLIYNYSHGVTDVENSLTVVKNSDMKKHDSEMMGNDTESDLTDAKITTVITTRYLFDSEVGGTDIDVDTDNGVVTLKGTVESDAEKQLAMEIAKNAEDVRKVVDELTVIAE